MKITILVVVAAIALTGCASFIQTKNVQLETINPGISYYLPKREHRLFITAENLNAKEEKTKSENATLLFNEQNNIATTLESEWKKLASDAANTPADEEHKKAKASAVQKAQTAEGIAKTARDAANKLEAAMEAANSRYDQAKANADAKKCNYFITMEITPQPLQPDTTYPFLLKLNSSPLRDEDLKIKTTSSGLLSSADVISTDRTGDIAVEIAKAVAMFGFGLPFPTSTMGLAKASVSNKKDLSELPPSCYPTILKFDEIVDFADYRDPKTISFKDSSGLVVSEKNYTLPKLDVSIKAPSPADLGTIINNDKELKEQNVPTILKGHYGILYRRDVSYLVELKNNDNGNTNIVVNKQISMPNLSPVSLLPYKYRPLVTTKNTATFENGMLVTYDTTQPSSVLALANLPAKVVEGYINALTNFLQLKIDYSTKEIAAIDKEKELAELLKSLQDTSKQNP